MSDTEGAAATRPSRFGPARFGQFLWRDPNTQYLLLSVVAGVLGGLGAIVFRTLTERLTGLLVDARDIVAGGESLPAALRNQAPAKTILSGLSWWTSARSSRRCSVTGATPAPS